MSTTDKIMELCLLTETICQSTQQAKILYIIDKHKKVSPKVLISKLGIVKSNLANICKQLELDKLIHKTKKDDDKRSVYYEITTKGKCYLLSELSKISINFRKDEITDTIKNSMDEILEFLNKKI